MIRDTSYKEAWRDAKFGHNIQKQQQVYTKTFTRQRIAVQIMTSKQLLRRCYNSRKDTFSTTIIYQKTGLKNKHVSYLKAKITNDD